MKSVTTITRGKLREGIVIPGLGTPLDDLSELIQAGGEVVDRGSRIYFSFKDVWYWVPEANLAFARIDGPPPQAGPGRPKKQPGD